MQPNDLSLELRSIAFAIDQGMTSASARSAVACLILATDRSLSVSIRDALMAEFEKLVPGQFVKYDTKEEGKGFRAGYVSFGIVPAEWKAAGLIGGILIQCDYNAKDFRSEAPENAGDDFQHSKGGGTVELTMTGCYYSHAKGNKCDPDTAVGVVPLSGADVYVDAKEKVFSVELVDADMTKAGLQSIVKDIIANPPDYAKSEKLKRKDNVPTSSPQALQKWLTQNGRSDVGQSELEALARAISNRTGKAYSNALQDVTSFFRSKQWAVNPNA